MPAPGKSSSRDVVSHTAAAITPAATRIFANGTSSSRETNPPICFSNANTRTAAFTSAAIDVPSASPTWPKRRNVNMFQIRFAATAETLAISGTRVRPRA